jgi:hypothetical protein
MRKQNDTQKLLQTILIKHKCKTIEEAWQIYRQQYEDVELDSAKMTKPFTTKPIPTRGSH